MKQLKDYKNAKQPTDILPFGAVSDETQADANDGTPILASQIQDIMYALYQIFQLAGEIPNGELEDGLNKKQFLQCLSKVGLFKYASTSIYSLSNIVWNIDNQDTIIYRSKVHDNNYSLSDTEAWEKLITIDKNNKINFHVETNISASGSNLPVFCFNSGPVDENGESILLSYDDLSKTITLTSPAKGTSANGETFKIEDNIIIDISGLEDGEYTVFYNPDNNALEVSQSHVYCKKSIPANIQNGDIFVDISVMPYKEYRKQNDELIASKVLPVGSLTILG